jgi:subtilisin-like proprotein convertase family protein
MRWPEAEKARTGALAATRERRRIAAGRRPAQLEMSRRLVPLVTALALVAGCAADGGRGELPARLAGDPCMTQGQSSDTPLALPDVATSVSHASLPAVGAGRVVAVSLTVDITHPYPRDLDLSLVSPSGTVVVVAHDRKAAYTQSTFSGAALFGALEGEAVNGTWTLRVVDDAKGDTGTLNSWSLRVQVCPLATCAGATVARDLLWDGGPEPVRSGWLMGQIVGVAEATVKAARVHFSTVHPFDQEVSASLTSPAGTSVNLTLGNGGSGNDYDGTVFDDAAAQAITAGVSPFAGSYRPQEPLAKLRGEAAAGDWGVWYADTITDSFTGGIPTVSLELDLCELSCPLGTHPRTAVAEAVLDVPDLGAAHQSLAIDDTGAIDEVAVRVSVSHQNDGQLTLRVRSPHGTWVTLAARRGGTGADFFGTLFDDRAPASVTQATPPFASRLRPESALGVLAGESAAGMWQVEAADGVAGVAGTLGRAEVMLCIVD